MSSTSSEEECHLCQGLKQAEDLKTKKHRIIKAVEEDDVDSLETLLCCPKWYRIRDEDKNPLLHIAIIRSRKEVFDYLLSLQDYPLEEVDGYGTTVLMMISDEDIVDYVQVEEREMREHFAYKLIERGADLHQVSLGNTLLHKAVEKSLIGIAELLIDKGVNVNMQDDSGNTPLHICCADLNVYNFEEEAFMLLDRGADPMICNCEGFSSFDWIIKFSSHYRRAAQEILNKLIVDHYSNYDIDAEAFMIATELDPILFYDLNRNIREVIFNDYLSSEYVSMLFTMQTDFLQIIIEEFDYVVKELLCAEYPSLTKCRITVLVENFYVLMDSKLKLEFTNWLSNVDIRYILKNDLLYSFSTNNSLSIAHEFICFLLSYGMRVFERDLESLYRRFGYCELFKILLHMDVEKQPSNPIRDIMPYVLYNVTLDLPKMIVVKNILLSPEFSTADLKKLLVYYTIPFDLLTNRFVRLENVQNQRRVPLLLELARNVFRRYFIQRLNIRNAKQFYTFVKVLSIGNYYKQIITLEVKLY